MRLPRKVLISLILSTTTTVWASATAAAEKVELSWEQADGVVLRTPAATVFLDKGTTAGGPVLRFLGKGKDIERRLSDPRVEQPGEGRLVLRYEIVGPDANRIEATRRFTRSENGEDFVEEFTLRPTKTIDVDLEIDRPFQISVGPGTVQAILPLFNGHARTFQLGKEPLRGQWHICNVVTDVPSHQLGLPVVQIGQAGKWLGALSADPTFASLFELTAGEGHIRGTIRYRYAGSKVPLSAGKTETRKFGVWLCGNADAAKAQKGSIAFSAPDAFFRQMLPETPPGPAWLHEIAMVGYDFLSDGGEGWERDVRELARLLTPAERRRVALCLHGWYDTLGGYSFDDARKTIKPQWTAMARTRNVPMGQDGVRRRLKLARGLGFRTLLYFADGMIQDEGAPSYRADWDLVTIDGKRFSGWTGPDTWGRTYVRNPAHPEVFRWHQDYLAALLAAFGPDVDGFVWDETFHVPACTISLRPRPAYCDRAMFELVKKLTEQVEAVDPQKVFLVSDSPNDKRTIPGYAMVADGTYQDSGCWMGAWPYGLFSNWRNTLWSCNWGSLSRFEKTKKSVERYGAPVAISNGWVDDRGPSEWTPAEREKILALFRRRLAQKERVRFLNDGQK
jgi:hypothetical protein